MEKSLGSGIPISGDANVDEVITRYPATARVFIRRRMACVGCEIARFETIADVCQIYHQPLEAVLTELRQAAVGARHRLKHYPV